MYFWITSSGMPPCGPISSVSCSRISSAVRRHHPVDAGGAHEHVVRLLLEHELAGPAQRVERGLLQRAELVLAVPVGEVGEHEERQPVRGLLVERAEDARRVEVTGVALQQRLGLLAAVAAEVGVQQVDHRPQVPALLHVDLEQVAQVVEATARSRPSRRCCSTEAGSVSPWMTISRCRSARYSPGTCCQTGSPFCSPKAIRRSVLRSARNTPQRYSSIATWSKCAQPSRPTATAVRR